MTQPLTKKDVQVSKHTIHCMCMNDEDLKDDHQCTCNHHSEVVEVVRVLEVLQELKKKIAYQGEVGGHSDKCPCDQIIKWIDEWFGGLQ